MKACVVHTLGIHSVYPYHLFEQQSAFFLRAAVVLPIGRATFQRVCAYNAFAFDWLIEII